MKTYDQFIKDTEFVDDALVDNTALRHIYEDIVYDPVNLIKMSIYAQKGYCPLDAVVKEIVDYSNSIESNGGFLLQPNIRASADDADHPKINYNHQIIGRIIRNAMEDIGFRDAKNNALVECDRTHTFGTAARYDFCYPEGN